MNEAMLSTTGKTNTQPKLLLKSTSDLEGKNPSTLQRQKNVLCCLVV